MKEQPYLFIEKLVKVRAYNPNYGDNRKCKCSHKYIDHFRSGHGSHPKLIPDICPLCDCYVFMEE
jgi:hypothetical protein